MTTFVRRLTPPIRVLAVSRGGSPKRAQIGDFIEIPTAKGLAYAQYTHQHPTHGGLIRVFDTLYEKRPSDYSDLARSPVRFSTFIPLRASVSRGIFKVVGRAEIAPHNRPFPLFRGGNVGPKTKKVAVWWFWDGESEWKVGEITPEQREMPIVGIWNVAMLVERIESGWTPQNDPR